MYNCTISSSRRINVSMDDAFSDETTFDLFICALFTTAADNILSRPCENLFVCPCWRYAIVARMNENGEAPYEYSSFDKLAVTFVQNKESRDFRKLEK